MNIITMNQHGTSTCASNESDNNYDGVASAAGIGHRNRRKGNGECEYHEYGADSEYYGAFVSVFEKTLLAHPRIRN